MEEEASWVKGRCVIAIFRQLRTAGVEGVDLPCVIAKDEIIQIHSPL